MDHHANRPVRQEGFGHDDGDGFPIVVGVSRTVAARAAASWAAVEARDRGIPVRLVAVIRHERERSQAQESLRGIRALVETAEPTVRVDAVIRVGEPSDVLAEESAGAAMVCLGTSHRAGTPLQATVAAVAERAPCPVAVIRPCDFSGGVGTGVVAVVLDDDPGNDAVVATAMEEGRRRNAVVRQIDHRLDSWVRRFPDVHVEIVADGVGRSSGCPGEHTRPQLAVLPKTDAARLVDSTSPCYHPIVGYPDVSMLFVPTACPSHNPRREDEPVDDTTGTT